MSKSDYDLELLADQILARMGIGLGPPTIAEIAQHIESMGFAKTDADVLGRLVVAKSQHRGLKPRHIVVLVHGIRTHAEWHGLAGQLFAPYCSKVVPIKYDFFDLIRFWIPVPYLFRIFPIRRVEDELKSIIADNPMAHISVVAHSFGTYVISKILRRNFNIRLFRLLLCGSIIPTGYEWRRLPNKPRGGILNDVGLDDRLPICAEVFTWGYGASGTYGFGTSEIDDNFHNVGHSGFFKEHHLKKYWVPFLFHGEVVMSPSNVTRKQPNYLWQILRFLHVKYLGLAFLFYLIIS